VDIVTAFIAHPEAAELHEPRQRPFHHPAVAPQALRGLDSPPRDPRDDPSRAQCSAAPGKSYALSARNFAGRRRGRSRGRAIGGMPSTTVARTVESWTLAAVSTTASGIPCRSTTTWRFEPGLPRSVGFGPVCGPSLWPARCWRPAKLASSRSGRHRQGDPAGRGGAGPTRRLVANRGAGANRLPRCRSPVPGGATLRMGQVRRQEGFDRLPEMFGDQDLAHAQTTANDPIVRNSKFDLLRARVLAA
jgi:hypothetical protein